MRRISVRLPLAAGLAVMLPALAGCNTMEGLGEDIQAAGRALEGEAEEADSESD